MILLYIRACGASQAAIHCDGSQAGEVCWRRGFLSNRFAAPTAGGIDHPYFTSGSEIAFFQEATAKARAPGHNKVPPPPPLESAFGVSPSEAANWQAAPNRCGSVTDALTGKYLSSQSRPMVITRATGCAPNTLNFQKPNSSRDRPAQIKRAAPEGGSVCNREASKGWDEDP